MFSQFRHAVENLAAHPRSSTDTPSDEQSNAIQSNSVETPPGPISPVSSSQLAESAISSLRKSFGTNRIAAPMTKSASLPSITPSEKPRQKLNLEERLRASLSAADVSTASTPPEPSPPTTTAMEDTLSPSSTPLPDSPMISPLATSQDPPWSCKAKDDPPSQTPESVEGAFKWAEAEGSDKTDELQTPATASDTLNSEDVNSATKVEPVDDKTEPIMLVDAPNREPDGGPSDPAKNELEQEPSLEQMDVSTDSWQEASETPGPAQKEEDNVVTDVDALQQRLKQVEERFTNVSTSFKRLQAEKLAADAVIRDVTPLISIQDVAALKKYLQSMNSKAEVFQEEIKRLNAKLEVQEDRIEEMRETHKLSLASQVDQIDRLQSQLRETDALLSQSQKSITALEETISLKEKEITSLKSDAERLSTVVKEEEEKRTKAISLLKSVRQKLVKAEKDKEDALREAITLREKDKADMEKEQVERRRLEREIEAINTEKEKSLASLRSQFEKELTSLAERHDKEMAAMRGQFELEAITTKSAHNKEIANKNSHINTLETSLNNVTRDKNAFFEQLQLRQAETESAQSHLESIQHQNTELQYQLREAIDRVTLLKENISELQREQELRSREPDTSAENIAHLLATTESKYEAKVAELKRINVALEKERNDSEAEWSCKLKVRGAEIEELKRLLGSSAKSQEEEEEVIARLEMELEHKNEDIVRLERQLVDMSSACNRLENAQISTQAAASELQAKILGLEKQIEEGKAKDAQLRQTNKSLREELRKVQSSVALLERQRNPGVGYWTTRTSESSPSDAATPTPGIPRTNSPVPESSTNKNEEEVNLEYLRNVILQFLEHKEMRPNLVRVLSIILHFTPQETRRLMSKV